MQATQSQEYVLRVMKPMPIDRLTSDCQEPHSKSICFSIEDPHREQCIAPRWTRYRLACEAGKDYAPCQDVDLVILDMLRDMITLHVGPDGTAIDHGRVHQMATDLLALCDGSRRLSLLTPVISAVDKDDLELFAKERDEWFRRRQGILKHTKETSSKKNKDFDDDKNAYFHHVKRQVCQRCSSIPLATRIAVHGWKKCEQRDEKEGMSLFIVRNWSYLKMKFRK